jgi:hypothetical protein
LRVKRKFLPIWLGEARFFLCMETLSLQPVLTCSYAGSHPMAYELYCFGRIDVRRPLRRV